MFAPNHPILLRAINLCIYNINYKTSRWLPKLTGPAVFTNAVNYILTKHYQIKNNINLFYLTDQKLNSLFNNRENNNQNKQSIFCRFYGSDYNDFCKYDNGCKDIILKDTVYWKNDKDIFA
jgi:hypothetical protein